METYKIFNLLGMSENFLTLGSVILFTRKIRLAEVRIAIPVPFMLGKNFASTTFVSLASYFNNKKIN